MACAIVTQHNIYKSSDKKTDEEYKKWGLDNILSTSPVLVTKTNKILSLLCLVDTVDLIKKKSISSDVYKRIGVSCTNCEISIRYDQFYNEESSIGKDEISEIYENIRGLSKWTEFKTTYKERMTIVISL